MRAAGLITLLAASTALGRPLDKDVARDFFPVGALVTVTGHQGDDLLGGLGIELSYVHYLGHGDVYGDLGIGPYAQVQMVNATRVRGALGFELNILFLGLSVGAAVEQGDAHHATTALFDLQPYLTFGYVSLGFRIGVPLGTFTSGPIYGIELGGAFTVKWPIPLKGKMPDLRRAF